MPYGPSFGNINPETGLPDTDPYPNAGANQGTLVPDGFIAPPAKSRFQSPPSNDAAVTAARVAGVLTIE